MTKDNSDQSVENVKDVAQEPEILAPAVMDLPVTKRGRKRDEVNEKLFDDTIEFIQTTIKAKVFEGAVEIGLYIFKHYYNSDPALVASKDPKKETSLRKLASRNDCPLTYSSISNMLHVAVQEQFLKEGGVDVDNLHYTNKIKLLAIKNSDKKISIANDIIGMSVRKAWKLIATQRDAEKGERLPRISDLTKTLRHFIHDPRFKTFNYEEKYMRNLGGQERADLKAQIKVAMDELKKASRAYKIALENIEKIEKEPPEVIEL